jgi:hypothetical protein
MKHGTIQKFLEAAAGTANEVFGEPTQRVAPEGGAVEKLSGMRLRRRVGSWDQRVGQGRARPWLRAGREVRYLPAAAEHRGYGRRRQSAGR